MRGHRSAPSSLIFILVPIGTARCFILQPTGPRHLTKAIGRTEPYAPATGIAAPRKQEDSLELGPVTSDHDDKGVGSPTLQIKGVRPRSQKPSTFPTRAGRDRNCRYRGQLFS